MALVAGSEQGITLEDNVRAFGEIGFRPHIADLPQQREQATSVLGQEIAFPVVISPTGVQAVSPEGEVAVARAAAAAGTAMGLSSFASKPVADVVAANPATFFQTYWVGGRDRILQRAERARAVLIGRAYLWGMAANGERGVANVLQILRSGIDEALLGLGRSSVHDLCPEDLIIPPDFTRLPQK
jgi:isopentenyl diphosphate isomerase/L-lactate dehydrogenase-like FMN-dependent dehydrogenase